MSDPIGPGDWVECVDAQPRSNYTPVERAAFSSLRLGALYRVIEVSPRGGLLLFGAPSCYDDFGFGWRFDRFRPVHRPGKSTLIRDLLTKVPEGVEA